MQTFPPWRGGASLRCESFIQLTVAPAPSENPEDTSKSRSTEFCPFTVPFDPESENLTLAGTGSVSPGSEGPCSIIGGTGGLAGPELEKEVEIRKSFCTEIGRNLAEVGVREQQGRSIMQSHKSMTPTG